MTISSAAMTAAATAKPAVDSPVALVDLDRLDANVERMAAIARDARVDLRPHGKSHKLPQVARRQIDAGAVGLTVAKLGEAEVFVDGGVEDVLVAFPLWGEAKWRRACELARRVRLAVAVDSRECAEELARRAAELGVVLGARIEVEAGFHRCGVQTPAQAADLAERIAALPALDFEGVMSFAGQSYEQPIGGASRIARADAAALAAAADAIRARGIEVRTVSAGGTPTVREVARLDGITEIRPGAYAFSDRDQVAHGWGSLEDCALTIAATVVSRPVPERAVTDAGTKALSSDAASQATGWGAVVGRPDLAIDRLTEEHGIIDVPAGVELPLGTQLRIVPNHGCGTLNMHDEVVVHRGGDVLGTWRVAARGKLR